MRHFGAIPAALLIFQLALPLRGFSPEEEAAARKLAADPGVVGRGIGTPAEFASNQRGWMEEGSRALLDGTASPARKARIIGIYSRIHGDIQRGLAWKEPRRSLTIPHLSTPPRIDGIPEPEEWRESALFEGEFPLDATEKQPGEPTRWRIGWHGEKLHAAAEFRDPEPEYFDYAGFDGKETPMYLGDAFEFFLRPSDSSRLYYEFLVNPAGKLWALAHVNDPRGSWIRIADHLPTGAEAAAARTPEGYSVELAVPLAELYGPGFRRTPQSGDRFTFMMVRTDRKKGEYRRGTPVPLLYEGHNIYGYIEARLGEAGTPQAE